MMMMMMTVMMVMVVVVVVVVVVVMVMMVMTYGVQSFIARLLMAIGRSETRYDCADQSNGNSACQGCVAGT
eukprot:COSAG05_NODE_554_length_8710_cov_178.656137_4_plen_71_part_00